MHILYKDILSEHVLKDHALALFQLKTFEEQNKAKLNKNQKLKTENEHLQAVLTTYKKMIEELNIANK